MKRFAIFSLLVLNSFLILAQDRRTFSADADTTSQDQIRKLEFLLAGLIEKGDADSYSSYLTDDYVRISANGEVSTKEEVLLSMRSASPGNFKMNPQDLTVRVYGNTAILNARLDLETKKDDVVTRRSSLITKVFIKRDGNWYLSSLQGTAIFP